MYQKKQACSSFKYKMQTILTLLCITQVLNRLPKLTISSVLTAINLLAVNP